MKKIFAITFKDPTDNEETVVTTDGKDLLSALSSLKEAGWIMDQVTGAVETF